MSIHGADRRPWLIISRREAEALLHAVRELESLTPEMARAAAQLRCQLAFIGGHDGDVPTADRAVEREEQRL